MATKAPSAGSKRKGDPANKFGRGQTPKKLKPNSEPQPKQLAKVDDFDMERLGSDLDSDDGGAKLYQSPLNGGRKSKSVAMDGKPAAKASTAERGQSSRESHAKQKQLAQERRAAKPLADELHRTKKLWERLRRKSHVPSEERKRLVEELFGIITGRVKDFVLKHDAVRAVQAAIKYANAAQRKRIAWELRGSYGELAESRYAKFLIGKLMVQNDEEIRDMIIPEFYGKVRKLINHPEAAWILDDIYRVVATKEQKAILLREWYGPEFTFLGNTDGAMALDASLEQILAAEPSKRGPIMKNIFGMVNPLVQKKMTGFTMLHDAMLQYFLNLKRDTEDFNEFFEMVKGDEGGDLLKNMAFTRSGSRLVSLLLAHGTAKDRRHILKTYKSTFTLMSGDPFGHIVILTAYDVIDDTKMTSKAIFPEILGEDEENAVLNLVAASNNPHARVILLYLLAGVTRSLFPGPHSEDVDILSEVHEIRKVTSKKDDELRRAELVAALVPHLLKMVVASPSTLMSTSFGCQLVGDVLLAPVGDKKAALEAVAALAVGDPTEDIVPEDGGLTMPHISRTAHGGRLFKILIAGGKFDKKTGRVEKVEPRLDFPNILYPVIKDYVVDWATGPSSFVVLNLLEADDFSRRDELENILKSSREVLQKAATEETAEQRAEREARELNETSHSPAKKAKKSGGKQARPVGNAGTKLLIERLAW